MNKIHICHQWPNRDSPGILWCKTLWTSKVSGKVFFLINYRQDCIPWDTMWPVTSSSWRHRLACVHKDLLEKSCTHCRMALLIVRHHHYCHYYCCYCCYGNASNRELAFFKCTVWNNMVPVLQPSGARLWQVMLLAWHGVCRNLGALGDTG